MWTQQAIDAGDDGPELRDEGGEQGAHRAGAEEKMTGETRAQVLHGRREGLAGG